jgi:hypothetical protein
MNDSNRSNSVERSDLLEALGKASALATALFPVSGVIVRWIALTPTGPAAFEMAYSAPLGQLAMSGLLAIFPTALIFAFAFRAQPMVSTIRRIRSIRAVNEARQKDLARLKSIIMAGPRDGSSEELNAGKRDVLRTLRRHNEELHAFVSLKDEQPKRRRLLWIALILSIPIAIFGSVLLALTSLLAGFASSALFFRSVQKGRYGILEAVWPAVVVATLLSALGAGLEGYIPGAALGEYRFDRTQITNIEDGVYVNLAESSTFMFLQSCEVPTRPVVKVQKDTILTVTLVDKDPFLRNPSLYQLWRGRRFVLGAHPNCQQES